MADKNVNPNEMTPNEDEINLEDAYCIMEDEDGNSFRFEPIASAEIDGVMYHAMIPVDDQPEDEDMYEYVIFKIEIDENGDEMYVSVDDDEEADRISDYFDDMLSDEADYDINSDDE